MPHFARHYKAFCDRIVVYDDDSTDNTREIAEKLRLSVKTVDTYREHIKEKLNLKNATELIQHASQWELTRQK